MMLRRSGGSSRLAEVEASEAAVEVEAAEEWQAAVEVVKQVADKIRSVVETNRSYGEKCKLLCRL